MPFVLLALLMVVAALMVLAFLYLLVRRWL
jgi:hypothetical protein